MATFPLWMTYSMVNISTSEQRLRVHDGLGTSKKLTQGVNRPDGQSWSSMLADFFDFRSFVSEAGSRHRLIRKGGCPTLVPSHASFLVLRTQGWLE